MHNDEVESSAQQSARIRPKSAYSGRVLVFEDDRSRGASNVTPPAREKSAAAEPPTSHIVSSNTAMRKAAYQTRPSHSLKTDGPPPSLHLPSSASTTTNLVRVRNSNLGKSAPSLSASMVRIKNRKLYFHI